MTDPIALPISISHLTLTAPGLLISLLTLLHQALSRLPLLSSSVKIRPPLLAALAFDALLTPTLGLPCLTLLFLSLPGLLATGVHLCVSLLSASILPLACLLHHLLSLLTSVGHLLTPAYINTRPLLSLRSNFTLLLAGLRLALWPDVPLLLVHLRLSLLTLDLCLATPVSAFAILSAVTPSAALSEQIAVRTNERDEGQGGNRRDL